MHLEFLSDRKSFVLLMTALAALAVLAAAFVYPRPVLRRLFAVRAAVIFLFFFGAISLTAVYPAARTHEATLYVMVDRSVSMDQKPPSGGSRSPQETASEYLARLKDACDSAGANLQVLYFAEQASDQMSQIGRRTTTQLSPAFSLLLDRTTAPGQAGSARAILLSDGAAADEPMIEPYLTALNERGLPVDVMSIEEAGEAGAPKLFFRTPAPSVSTVGESIPIDIGVVSSTSVRLTVLEGNTPAADRTVQNPAELSSIYFVPKTPGLRTIVVTAQNQQGSTRAQFRMKVLPRLLLELEGQPSWDARFFLVSASRRPGVSVRGRWGSPPSSDTQSVVVYFGGHDISQPPASPVIFWAQSEMRGENRGIRWLGRQSGSWMPTTASDPRLRASGRLQPLSGRQKILLDLGWTVLDRYPDDMPFLAERTDTSASLAFLVNGEGLWRWWLNPVLASADPLSASSPAYEAVVDRIIQWARRAAFPPAELFSVQESGQMGVAMEFLALFSIAPRSAPPLTVVSPDGSREQVYGVGTSAIRYSYVPRRAGTYQAVLSAGSLQPATAVFDVSDVPFDVAHPEPRPDLLRHIAGRTGGRLLASSHDRMNRPMNADALLSEIHALAATPIRAADLRVRLTETPAFFAALILLFAVLWTLESKWIR